ncbi:hypothetical protein [Fluviicola taffensis]|uniref:Uncharacterized protein n=1 Tax=Fluviicola taffensis (strain DSM 16823 / NCIMB 13979 / RW262) TaxID=755732 RepID=F2IE42_FLUTR|nr:hypothetical protein [Fluviicola taffensis]AEA45606.1 hypothetical protein Fluta_3637 [Fluviicola taffensis DSM 16823]
MNAAHSHLIINHFPIIGLVLGIIVLLIGILAKSSVTRRVGLLLFIIAGITAQISDATGEGAEHIVEHASSNTTLSMDCPDAIQATIDQEEETETLIHIHEKHAEELMPFMWGILALSVIALFLEFKKKSMAMPASIIVLIIGVIGAYFAKEVGNSGGEISHPEIRKDFKLQENTYQDED